MDVLSRTNLMIIAPLFAVQLIVQVVALVDLYRREQVTGGKKWIWVLVIVFGEILGAIIYFIFGRKED